MPRGSKTVQRKQKEGFNSTVLEVEAEKTDI